jgi:hypothetical protein
MFKVSRKCTPVGQRHDDAVGEAASTVGIAGAALNGESLRNEVRERTNRGHVMGNALFIRSFFEPEPRDVHSRHVRCPPSRFVNNNTNPRVESEFATFGAKTVESAASIDSLGAKSVELDGDNVAVRN